MRRGQAEMLSWMPRLIMVAVAVVIIVSIVYVYTQRDLKAEQMHRAAYLYRIYYSDVIMFSQGARIYPGIVDMAKFNQERMDLMTYEKTFAQLKVSPGQGCAVQQKTIYTNKLAFEEGKVWQLQGAGGRNLENVVYPVTLKDGTRECAGTLNITIVRTNQ
jgi:hypothetical protein